MTSNTLNCFHLRITEIWKDIEAWTEKINWCAVPIALSLKLSWSPWFLEDGCFQAWGWEEYKVSVEVRSFILASSFQVTLSKEKALWVWPLSFKQDGDNYCPDYPCARHCTRQFTDILLVNAVFYMSVCEPDSVHINRNSDHSFRMCIQLCFSDIWSINWTFTL